MSTDQSSSQAAAKPGASPPPPLKSHDRSYPQYLRHADRVLGLFAILSLMAGGTILIFQIWQTDIHEWVWRLCGNLGALLAFCLFSFGINQLLGRSSSLFARLSHLFLIICLIGCLVVVTLVIWGEADADVAWRAIGTIATLIVVSCIGIAVSKTFVHKQ